MIISASHNRSDAGPPTSQIEKSDMAVTHGNPPIRFEKAFYVVAFLNKKKRGVSSCYCLFLFEDKAKDEGWLLYPRKPLHW